MIEAAILSVSVINGELKYEMMKKWVLFCFGLTYNVTIIQQKIAMILFWLSVDFWHK